MNMFWTDKEAVSVFYLSIRKVFPWMSSQIQIIPEAICSVLKVVLPFATSSFAAEPGFMSSFYSICPENLNH